MNHGRVSVAAGVALLLACGVESLGTVTFGQEGGRGRVPDDAALLGTGETTCDGSLMVESGDRDGGGDARRVPRGENRVLRVENTNVSWVCLGENGTHSDTMECPAETTHVRINRRDDDEVTTFECYSRNGRGRNE